MKKRIENYIEKFIEDNNIKLYEEFKIYDENGAMHLYSPFYFNENLNLMNSIGRSSDSELSSLLYGKHTIEFFQHKPKLEEPYWTLSINNGNIYEEIWKGDFIDYTKYHLGMTWKTQAEAEAKVNKDKFKNYMSYEWKNSIINEGKDSK